tara:strand:- start:41 stop:691 length:651 start_codon:yes stop_codon:yes gene_type:complete
MKVSVKTNIKKISKGLTAIQKKQIPFATMLALNDTAFAVHRAEKKQTTQKFSNPTNFTQKGFRVDKAKKNDLKAVVYVEKKREDYMKLEVDGGTRTPKKSTILVPNKSNAKDISRYPSGNITKGAYSRIKKNKKKYFFGVPKGNQGSDGIWERYGREATGTVSGQRIRQVARLTKSARYKALFPFETIGQGVAFSRKNGFESHYSKRLKYALRTAK